jgi:penicillin-binding protein 1B
MAPKQPRRSRQQRARGKAGSTSRWRRTLRTARKRPLLSAAAFLLAAFTLYAAVLNWQITERFEGRRWDLPAHVYARPLELYAGLALTADQLEAEVSRLGYRAVAERPGEPGTFRRYRNRIELKVRPFDFWDGLQPSRYFAVTFDDERIERVSDGIDEIAIGRVEPLLIGSIFPESGEDRLVVAPEDVPPLLPAALKAVEDRRFDEHFGVDPIALVRALGANVRAGAVTQGGSTLTQQLVKNYFLDNRRTLWRKLKEAIMAVILELHYDKADILNAYINEVYMGQQGNRAIHGFGLASRFYFSRPLDELELHQVALLVAIVRGPGYYDPVRFPERASARRNLVLAQMAEQGAIPEAAAEQAADKDLDLWDAETLGAGWYPAYLDLVRQQLAVHYREEDLTREGLQVFTALDPVVQATAERRLAAGLERLDAARDTAGAGLDGAVVVTSAQSGEVNAVVGGRRAGYAGFNRALDARRPIGSLVKPAVYLAALETGRYTLASTIDDAPVDVELANGNTWTPANFHEEESHGRVTLLRALAESMNLATVRLGLDTGVEHVAAMLGKLGFDGQVAPYPSLLLGAVGMTPLEVAQVYGTLAGGGFRTPLRAVRAVVDTAGEPLQRYPLEVVQAVDSADVYQLNQALAEVMRRGTGKSVRDVLSGRGAAGKTGTSDGLRDSWFAGFTGEHVMVVWVGYDDNRPTGLTGATGALPIWAAIVDDIGSAPLAPVPPAGLESRWIQYETGVEVSRLCTEAVELMLPAGAALDRGPRCGIDLRRLGEGTVEWFREVIE